MDKDERNFEMFIKLLDAFIAMIGVDEPKEKTDEERHQTFEKVYRQLVEKHWILDPDVIIGLLKYYTDKKDVDKCYNIAYYLVRYYRGYVQKVYDIWTKDEEYEKCQFLKNILRGVN